MILYHKISYSTQLYYTRKNMYTKTYHHMLIGFCTLNPHTFPIHFVTSPTFFPGSTAGVVSEPLTALCAEHRGVRAATCFTQLGGARLDVPRRSVWRGEVL